VGTAVGTAVGAVVGGGVLPSSMTVTLAWPWASCDELLQPLTSWQAMTLAVFCVPGVTFSLHE
jgi:hypothetical protein